MPAYEVLLSRAARKQLNILPAFIHNKMIEDITELSSTPRPAGCKKLKGCKMHGAFGLAIIGLSMKLKIKFYVFWSLQLGIGKIFMTRTIAKSNYLL